MGFSRMGCQLTCWLVLSLVTPVIGIYSVEMSLRKKILVHTFVLESRCSCVPSSCRFSC